MVLNGNFKSGFPIELHIKDLTNALDIANEFRSLAVLTGQISEIMGELQADGKGKHDRGGLIQ